MGRDYYEYDTKTVNGQKGAEDDVSTKSGNIRHHAVR
jgi:hypothetical protein